jgi:serine/threonine-protein kinase PknG
MDGTVCRQPGCGGTIEGGFCNRCGLEPPTGTVAMVGPPPGSARSTAASVGSGRTGSTASRGSGTGRTSSRKNLGLGMVAVPELPPIDPENAILADPQVPETRRFCGNPDCRDAGGNPTALNRRAAGHCPRCGRRYSFVPTLNPGDLVAGQYEVKGCLAYGGLGWIYLARDAVLNRWVVLKGLLNAADETAAAAAVAERQFLAAVKHPNIVGIYNFVNRGTEGYIVMEYVAGRSLRELRKERGPLPPAEAVAYVHRALGAFAYLHERNLVYCDFKPDNFMLEGDPPDVKLIDLGGVRWVNDTGGDVYGTRGYTAPEAAANPTIASDLYTVGRALAVLVMDFRYQGAYEFTLPPPSEQPVLARHDSLYRFLRRATDRDPDARFRSAQEMADQLAGVLREVVAEIGGEPRPAESSIFGGDVFALHHGDHPDEPSAALVPALKPDPDDPGAGFLLSIGVLGKPGMRAIAIAQSIAKFPESSELPLRLAEARIATGDYGGAEIQLAVAAAKDPSDWRVGWYRGLLALAEGKAGAARPRFEAVYHELPGEPAAKLALALAAEAAADDAIAAPLYDRVSRTDPGFVTASFGLARCLLRADRRAEAADALRRVPPTSSAYTAAQIALARALLGSGPAPSADDLVRAAEVVQALGLEGADFLRLRVEVLERALALLTKPGTAPPPGAVLDEPFAEAPLRRALEATLRQLARLETDRSRQIELIDRANQVRPVTWV